MFNDFVNLAKQLYPTGRAFKMPFGSDFEKLTKAFSRSKDRFYNDALSTFNSILPDNALFTTDDCDDWERRLGMPNNSLATLADRKAAIYRKLAAPGINPAKGHYLSIEHQLQLANFNVWVHENIPAQSPFSVSGVNQNVSLQYGDSQYGGGIQFGVNYLPKVVNRIDEYQDLNFNLGGSYRCCFFIGGQIKGSFANVPAVRKKEFRELVLKLKQTQTVAMLFINFV